MQLTRFQAGSTSDAPEPIPVWMLECTGPEKSKGSVPPPFKTVLVGINASGLVTRPAPLHHNQLKGACHVSRASSAVRVL
jgi:hypothetical protein